jgi:peptidoglycan/LPS O-acetylase OafA/YrhL
MRTLLREVLVTTAAAVCLAGPVAGIVVPLSPEAWRSPPLVWGILLGAAALVAGLRRRRWKWR